MGKCEICGKEEDLHETTHPDRGNIKVCSTCLNEIEDEEESEEENPGSGLSCPHCG